MHPIRTYRLAQRAAGRGLWARRAMRQLIRLVDEGDSSAIDDAWDLWVRDPRDELWAVLSARGRPRSRDGLSLVALGQQAPAADVVEAARRTGHPIADIARAAILAGEQDLVDAACEMALTDEEFAGFCVEHQLAPADPHRAAVFFLLTGQREQYLLADPDHSLLAVAYQGAGEDERSRVRASAAGDPDLVRALADTVRKGRMARLSESEADYLADTFAARRDWPGLWELTRNLPVLDAATAVRRFDGWRPEGRDAALFDALASADPAGLATSHAAIARTWTAPASGTVSGGSIAPDGRRVVVTTTSTVDVFTFAHGTGLDHQERWKTAHNSEVLALDDDVLIISNWDHQDPGDDGFSALGYQQRGGSGPRTSGPCRFYRAAAFARTPDGFAALTYDDDRRPYLHLLSGEGNDFFQYERRDLDLLAELGIPKKYAHQSFAMATEPGSGLIAFAGDGLRLARITGDGLRLLASVPFDDGQNPYVAFAGPDRLVGLDDHKVLRVWRPDGDELSVVAERQLTGSTAAVLPGAGVVATIHWPDNTRRELRYLDRETLADIPAPGQHRGQRDPTDLVASPDGTRLLVGHHGFVEVIDVGLVALADRPLAAATPADLHALRARLDAEPTSPFLDLLHTCLEHRFGAEVAIGKAAPAAARDDDIALGGPA